MATCRPGVYGDVEVHAESEQETGVEYAGELAKFSDYRHLACMREDIFSSMTWEFEMVKQLRNTCLDLDAFDISSTRLFRRK
jgi:hypothetical protein